MNKPITIAEGIKRLISDLIIEEEAGKLTSLVIIATTNDVENNLTRRVCCLQHTAPLMIFGMELAKSEIIDRSLKDSVPSKMGTRN